MTKQQIAEALCKAIPKASYMEYGFGFADFTVLQGERLMLWCIILHNTAREDGIKIHQNVLESWSLYTKLFGPIPLALVRPVKFGEVEAKRISMSWDTEYANDANFGITIPDTGFVKL